MFFDEVSSIFAWPTAGKSLSPQTISACRKLRRNLSSEHLLRVKALPRDFAQNQKAEVTRSKAIVCEFSRRPDQSQLREAHRLAWNLCEGEQVIFLFADERIIQAWSCLVPPAEWRDAILGEDVTVPTEDEINPEFWQTDLLRAFHWVNLLGDYFSTKFPEKFAQENRADRLLIENLRHVRRELLSWEESPDQALPLDCCHNLLARLIFVQYLFQRSDSNGIPFLSQTVMERLHSENILTRPHESLAEILRHKGDTYELFRWLNGKFNGDLFPAESSGTISREKRSVRASHLRRLADYLDGSTEMATGQGLLWKHYSFEVIPINFISSLYEEFLTEDDRGLDKAHYTPSHLVDFILDTALPWHSDEWNVKILDPCCGSGIFLVKAFQRLVHRWRNAHPDKQPGVADLRRLLQKNLVGTDKNSEAVRVASFSLCLAMADEIDPRQYWQQTVFPPLRDETLITDDFFADGVDEKIRKALGKKIDLVIGNPPWGRNSGKGCAKVWAQSNDWPTGNNDIGPLFLAKSLGLAAKGGDVVMIQPAGLLMNQAGPVTKFRTKLYAEARILEVNNFSALRFGLFSKAIGPCCVIYCINVDPELYDVTTYLCPKQCGEGYVRIEPDDWHEIRRSELLSIPWIWTALMWGDRRNVELIRKYSVMPTVRSLMDEGKILSREGLIRGDQQQRIPEILERRIFSDRKLDSLRIQTQNLPKNDNPNIDSATANDLSAFRSPQLLIKQSWVAKTHRFHAAFVEQPIDSEGIICSDSYVSVSAEPQVLERVWLAYNSIVAVWWQLLRSGQFSSFIPKPLEKELREVPIPEGRPTNVEKIISRAEIDGPAFRAYKSSAIEKVLVEDIFKYTLADFKDGEKSIGRKSTQRGDCDPLKDYSVWLLRTIEAGLGHRKARVTIFTESDKSHALPLRLLAVHLVEAADTGTIDYREVSDDELLELFRKIPKSIFGDESASASGFIAEKHLRLYDRFAITQTQEVPTVFIAKPDRRGLWTRSAAMRDADEILADVLSCNFDSTI